MLDEVKLTVFHNDLTFIQHWVNVLCWSTSRVYYNPDIPLNNIILKSTNCITLYTCLYYIGYEIKKERRTLKIKKRNENKVVSY